jgi:hypothetical protein
MQNFFSFRLLAFALVITFSWACSPNPSVQGKGEVYLQGEWSQDAIPNRQQLLEYSTYQLRFSCDSFFVKINSYSKVNNGADSCMNSGHWTEYVKGHYQQRNDTLHLKGQFCNADYSLKAEGSCFRSGVYEELFKISKKNDTLVEFASTTSVMPIQAHLVKRTSCNPKPL